jgi:hypothetical protein
VTPGLEFTRGRATAGGTGGQAVDLGEIRRTEEAINALAARDAAGPDLTHDPGLALLGALVADVDTPGTLAGPGDHGLGDLQHAHPQHAHPQRAQARYTRTRPARGRHAQARAAWPGRAADQRAEAWPGLAMPSRGAAAWLRAGVAGGVVAGLASITSLIATSMLARLVRGPARGPARGGRYGQRAARPRRVR